MPQKNTVKQYAADSFYHIYNRGTNKQPIFIERKDYEVFLSLLKRYLGQEVHLRANREKYDNYYNQIELLAYCLLPNHFHLLIYQNSEKGIVQLMKSLGVAYAMYFNKRYKHTGSPFEQRYKAVMIDDDSQLLHITRYIHLNPRNYRQYEWSSLPHYLGYKQADWLRPKRIIGFFGAKEYENFLADYENRKEELDSIKHQLAGL